MMLLEESCCHQCITTIKQLIHCALAALHENHIHRGAGKTFVKSIQERSIEQQLLLGDDRTVNEALRHILKLEIIMLPVRSLSGSRK
jgi:fumarylacetoacetate (FAA) hydrolase family protein